MERILCLGILYSKEPTLYGPYQIMSDGTIVDSLFYFQMSKEGRNPRSYDDQSSDYQSLQLSVERSVLSEETS